MNVPIDISHIILRTERLILRPFTMDDVDDLYEYAKVEGVGEAAGWKHHESIEESKRICEMFINEGKVFAIEYNNKVIGSLGIETYDTTSVPEVDELKCREIGFVLSKDYWGQGIIKEASLKVIEYLFNDVGLDAVICCHNVNNYKSGRVQEKIGFKFLKESKRKSLYDVDDCIYTIIYNK